MIHPTVGQILRLIVVEPWEFDEPMVRNPFAAEVVAVSLDTSIATLGGIMIRALQAFEFEREQCEYFVGSRRLAEPASGPLDWTKAGYSFTRTSVERATGPNPFDLSWWRGGVGLIAGLSLATPEFVREFSQEPFPFWKPSIRKIDGVRVHVKFLGRSGVLYTENGRTMYVGGEMLAGNSAFVVYIGTIEKWDDGELISREKRARIASNIERFTKALGWVVEFEAPLVP